MRTHDILVSLAAGDMLGAPMEFKTPAQVKALYGEVTGPVAKSLGVFGAGEFTDDTQLALCLLAAYPADEGILARAGAAMQDWLARGPRDVGNLTREALRTDGVRAWRDSRHRSCGNGAVMRAAASNAAGRTGAALLEEAVLLGGLTHADPRSLLACAVLCAGIDALSRGAPYALAWEEALARAAALDLPAVVAGPLGAAYADEVRARRDAAWAEVEGAVRKALRGTGGGNSGYAVTTLQTAVAHGGAASFAEGVLPVVRQGDDSDTVAAVTGAILGARGLTAPAAWLEDLRSGERYQSWPHAERGPAAVLRLREVCLRAQGALPPSESRVGYPPDVPPFAVRRLAPQVLYGRNPLTAKELHALAAAGVTHILDLREEREWAAPGRLGREAVEACRPPLARLHLPVVDGGAPDPKVFPEALRFIDQAVASGGTVFVHCRAGRERTGAVLLAWWRASGREGALEAHGPSLVPLPHQRRAAEAYLKSSGHS